MLPFRADRCLLIPLVAMFCAPATADTPLDFDKDVRPVLEQHCFQCHGPDKQKGGLRLDVKTIALRGGDSGEPAVVPGSALKSHLLKLVASKDPDERMPPKGQPLSEKEIALLQRWIDTGAHWVGVDMPAATATVEVTPEVQISAADRSFWSFQPPRASDPPATRDAKWPAGRIDRFILAKLEARGLRPAPQASRETLIRRLTYDLTGLPPTPDEVAAFLADESPGAYERLVDRLLASPRFGERMASMWLPLARYAEDQAHQVGSDTKFFYPNAWKYRQWVIDAFNRDLPYDRFVTLQLAADHVADAPAEDQAALGFLGLGPKYYNRNRLEVQADEWEDRVDTVTRTMLGLTVACARCHDHKFDPVPTRDYYSLAGVFASTKMVNRTPDGKAQKGELKAEEVNAGTLHAVEDAEVRDLNVFIRGNVERKGTIAPRRFLSVLSPAEPAPFKSGSGRRELAAAIVDRGNPLTARVMVNRVWTLMTGAPLVATPSNFGRSGQPPTHPELLDDLAVRFMEPSTASTSSGQAASVTSGQAGAWSVKALVREIVSSSTYRQSAQAPPKTLAADPANELLGRMNRRRMTVEQWRDTVLFVSGRLDPATEGRSMELSDAKNRRRTVYARVSRLQLNELLMQFDYPDANVHAEGRSVTTTPAQKLFVLNSQFAIEQARAFAARLAEEEQDDAARVRRAYAILFAREPAAPEMELARAFLAGDSASARLSRWEQYAQVLLASNEALYVD